MHQSNLKMRANTHFKSVDNNAQRIGVRPINHSTVFLDSQQAMATDNTALPPAYPGENYTPNTQSEKTWRHGLCNCLDDPKFCFIGCFVPGSLLFGIAG